MNRHFPSNAIYDNLRCLQITPLATANSTILPKIFVLLRFRLRIKPTLSPYNAPESQTTSQPEIFVSSPCQKTPMNHDRTYSLFRPVPASRLRGADASMRPRTSGVRVCSCVALATDPSRPTACTTHTTPSSSPSPSTVH